MYNRVFPHCSRSFIFKSPILPKSQKEKETNNILAKISRAKIRIKDGFMFPLTSQMQERISAFFSAIQNSTLLRSGVCVWMWPTGTYPHFVSKRSLSSSPLLYIFLTGLSFRQGLKQTETGWGAFCAPVRKEELCFPAACIHPCL